MCRKSGYFLYLPEREDNNSWNHKDYSKHHEHAISGLMPFGIVEYFCTLENKNRNASVFWDDALSLSDSILVSCVIVWEVSSVVASRCEVRTYIYIFNTFPSHNKQSSETL